MPQIYLLHEAERIVGGTKISKTGYVELNEGKDRIAYFIIEAKTGEKKVVIPGIVSSGEYKTGVGKSAVSVKPVTDENLIGELEKRLGDIGEIEFWKM